MVKYTDTLTQMAIRIRIIFYVSNYFTKWWSKWVYLLRNLLCIYRHCLLWAQYASCINLVLTFSQLFKKISARNQYRQDFYDAWQAADLDLVLCPPHPLPAVPHDSFGDISFGCCYTALYNLLDYPAGVVPVTAVNPSTDR